ncbi:MAG: hypothetical protein WCD18_22235 [Thermosynechococcaceae cyanobacterium]
MAEQASDEILQLAEQGNLQALSVYLNRHLIPSGAHVKIKQKEEALHVLVVAMQDSKSQALLQSVQQLLIRLRPTRIKRVKLYTQELGQKDAKLKQQFSLVPDELVKQDPATVINSTYRQPLSQPQAPPKKTLSSFPSNGTAPKSNPPFAVSTPPPKRRYSVAEFLSQTTNIEELKVLRHHPFFTGSCPQCNYQFEIERTPPVYWDCPQCKWHDDLNQFMPHRQIRGNNPQTSLSESKRLGDYLVEAGLLTDTQIEVALADQLTTGLRFGEVLVRRGWIKEETIEYLMQKIVVPERSGLQQNTASYLESSRNLLKTLMQDHKNTTVATPPSSDPPPEEDSQPTPPSPLNSKNDHTAPPPAVSNPPKLANERETLILPDLDGRDDLDEYLKGMRKG